MPQGVTKLSATWRERIKGGELITRLQSNALGMLKPPMTADQINSARILLNKALPDLRMLDIDLNATGDLNITVLQYSEPNDT